MRLVPRRLGVGAAVLLLGLLGPGVGRRPAGTRAGRAGMVTRPPARVRADFDQFPADLPVDIGYGFDTCKVTYCTVDVAPPATARPFQQLNEVPWEILDDCVAARPTAALARVLARSHCYTSMTADRGHLSPWTTWPTLHRGVNDERHMIASFGEDRSLADQRFPPIWSLLRDAGVSVGVCASLHTYPAPDGLGAYAFYLPTRSRPSRWRTRRSWSPSSGSTSSCRGSRDATSTPASPRRMPSRWSGTAAGWGSARRPTPPSGRSCWPAVQHVLHQPCRIRHAPLLGGPPPGRLRAARAGPGLGRDVPRRGHVGHRPGRGHGRARRAPGRGQPRFAAVDRVEHGTAGDHGRGPGDPALPHPADPLLRGRGPARRGRLAAPTGHAAPVNLVVEDKFVEQFRDALGTVLVGGEPLQCKQSGSGFFSLDFGQPNLHNRPDAVTIAGETVPIASLGMETVEIEDRSGTTAYHVPGGILAIYDPARPAAGDGARLEVSVLEVAPAVLQAMGVEPPSCRPTWAQPAVLAELLPA